MDAEGGREMHITSNAVVGLREKRSCSGNDDTPDKRLKNGDLPTVDSAMKVQSAVKDFCAICHCPSDHNHSINHFKYLEDHLISPRKLPTLVNGKVKQYCFICNCSTDHNHLKCPKRSTAIGFACSICYEPCDIKEHKGNWTSQIKSCVHCFVTGDHWSEGCPTPDDDDDLFC